MPVDSKTLLTLTFISRLTSLKVDVKRPGAPAYVPMDVLAAKHGAHGTAGKVLENSFGIDGSVLPTVTYYFAQPEAGLWGVKVSADVQEVRKFEADRAAQFLRAGQPLGDDQSQLFMLAFNESPYAVDSYLKSYESLKAGSQVDINGNLWLTTLPRLHPDAVVRPGSDLHMGCQVKTAMLELWKPDGTKKLMQMHDDGLHADNAAADGVYGVTFGAGEVGNYIAQVVFTGTTPDGHNFKRSSLHLLNIVRSDISVTTATVRVKDAERFLLSLVTPMTPVALSPQDDVTHRAYAEVWGTSSETGAMVPVAWVSSMTDLAVLPSGPMAGKLAFDLELNARWLEIAKATEPLELRNVYVQERNAWVPVAAHSTVPVTDATGVVEGHLAARRPMLAASGLAASSVITEEMRKGVNPYTLPGGRHNLEAKRASRAAARAAAAGEVSADPTAVPQLVLSHGFCAPENAWPIEDFTDAQKFEDLSQNRPTDLFARLIRDFGDPYDAGFSLVAHSQGGLASTHLNAAYWSKLNVHDEGQAPLVQSAGSPYQGVPVAGLIGAAGKIIGMGCGSIEDLTYDGARLWLAAVPVEQRKDTRFYTSQYETGHLVNYCVLAANAVLKWPNDGLTEVDGNQLPGGINMGNTIGQCHSKGMHYMPVFEDHARNRIINAAAKR